MSYIKEDLYNTALPTLIIEEKKRYREYPQIGSDDEGSVHKYNEQIAFKVFDFIQDKEKLIKKPATTGSHHFFKGGLLYHIYYVTRNAIAICNLYPDLEVDMDLVIFGGLLHDIGKTNEFNDFIENGDNTKNKGNSAALLGHSYEGTYIVENYLSKYNIDEQFKNQVIHIIGSHMNEYSEWGALVMPKMLEVIIINFADNIDAHI